MITTIPSTFNPKRILVCQQRQIGDVLLATPCIRLLKERFPGAEIHFLTEKKCLPILENNPNLSKVWVIDKKKGFLGSLSLYGGLLKEHFDLAIDFQQLIRLRFAVLFSGAEIRLSYPPKWYNRIFYNAVSPMLGGYAPKAKSGVLNILGIEWDMEPPEIYLSNSERQWADEYLQQYGIKHDSVFLTIDPTHRRETRKWPEENYAAVIEHLLGSCPELRVFMLYGPGEKDDVERIKRLASNSERCIVSEHMTTIREMCAVQARAAGHIGNCSSPRHTATAVSIPTLIVSGSNRPGGWRYPDSKHVNLFPDETCCRWCNSNECAKGTFECLTATSPEEVVKEALELFSLGKEKQKGDR